MTGSSNYELYKILGVDRGSSRSGILRAYKDLILRYHPDKPTGDASAFMLVNLAFNTLGDARKREAYDSLTAAINASSKQHSDMVGEFREFAKLQGGDPQTSGSWLSLASSCCPAASGELRARLRQAQRVVAGPAMTAFEACVGRGMGTVAGANAAGSGNTASGNVTVDKRPKPVGRALAGTMGGIPMPYGGSEPGGDPMQGEGPAAGKVPAAVGTQRRDSASSFPPRLTISRPSPFCSRASESKREDLTFDNPILDLDTVEIDRESIWLRDVEPASKGRVEKKLEKMVLEREGELDPCEYEDDIEEEYGVLSKDVRDLIRESEEWCSDESLLRKYRELVGEAYTPSAAGAPCVTPISRHRRVAAEAS